MYVLCKSLILRNSSFLSANKFPIKVSNRWDSYWVSKINPQIDPRIPPRGGVALWSSNKIQEEKTRVRKPVFRKNLNSALMYIDLKFIVCVIYSWEVFATNIFFSKISGLSVRCEIVFSQQFKQLWLSVIPVFLNTTLMVFPSHTYKLHTYVLHRPKQYLEDRHM
jgi:hypothetical protein